MTVTQLVLPVLAAATTQAAARSFPESERPFRADPRWLGATTLVLERDRS